MFRSLTATLVLAALFPAACKNDGNDAAATGYSAEDAAAATQDGAPPADAGDADADDTAPAAEDESTAAAAADETDAEAREPSAAEQALNAEIDAFIAAKGIDTNAQRWRMRLPEPPVFSFPEGSEVYWELSTSEGPIRIKLMPDVAPKHVSSTLYLTRLGFYDGLTFHRVIPQFMAQGGDPTGTGGGGPGYTYSGEFDPKVRHDRPGLLSMAHAGPGTDGSQFFLTFRPTPHLDMKHTIFGELVLPQSFATLKELESKGSPSGATKGKLVIEQARYLVK